jgi:glycosyltransferase involved in cell wall biosynthesis
VADKELPCFYRCAQFFVNPSLWESFSLQVPEAMACGTPIISSNRKALPEILGEAGLYFDPDDDFALPRLMRLLAEDANLREKLRGYGLKRAADFSWKKTAQETLSLYLGLISKGR